MACRESGATASNTLKRTYLYGAIFAAPLVLALTAAPAAEGQSVRTASLPPPDSMIDTSGLPTVLAADDALHYQRIFAMQHAGSWPDADHEASLLKDRLLMGEILAQRYLHHGYVASYSELAEWLRLYADEPNARAIYALATKRHPAGAPVPMRPTGTEAPLRFATPETIEFGATSDISVRGGTGSLQQLSDPFGAKATARSPLAALPFQPGNIDADGQPLALEVIQGSERGGADWDAGLAAWRGERYGEASQHFERAARIAGASSGQVAAAGYWAARSELRNHHPEQVDNWLGIAAGHPHTFYGLLARRTLGIDPAFNFDTGPLSEESSQLLRGTVPGRRALALIQVGSAAAAEAILRQMVAGHSDSATLRAVEGLADRAGMPALSFHLASLSARSDPAARDRAMFPVPHWAPVGGFKVDRALLFALMRQESQFRPEVRSASGALGPMQIMPATARSMARRLELSNEQRQELAEPAVNLALAQEYIAQLQADERIGRNLLLLAAAYNSGPGPIHQWLGGEAMHRDPLLFLESIPNRETRGFAERVLANYWIYRLRLGQPTSDLDALAAGEWPTYTALDSSGGRGPSYAKN
jgi:soluble lytic murein transglycosylase-like protein